MQARHITTIGALAALLATAACNQSASETRKDAIEEDAKVADAAKDVARQRNEEITRLSERVAKIEHDYTEKAAKVASGARTATAGLRAEVQEDVNNVKQAVANLSTTTSDNWWEREDDAMRATIDDVAADVKQLGGRVTELAPRTPGETPATAPFTSRRDSFVAEMKGRVDALDKALDNVKAKGPRETELDDTRARVAKIAEDLDRVARASADDWWDVTRERVSEYVDRVEASVKRLDDNKPQAE